MHKFYVQKSFWQLFLLTCNKRKAAEKMFFQKICAFNVDEIGGRKLEQYLAVSNFYGLPNK